MDEATSSPFLTTTRRFVALLFVVGISILSVWLTRISATSLVYNRLNKPIAETSYKFYALLYGLLCILCFVGSFFGVILVLTLCTYAYDKYYKMGFLGILWSILDLVMNGYSKDPKAILWVIIISASVMTMTLLLLSEQGKNFINSYFDSLQKHKEKQSSEEVYDNNGELVVPYGNEEDDPDKDILMSQKDGTGFVYKLYEIGNIIYVVVLLVVIEIIFVTS